MKNKNKNKILAGLIVAVTLLAPFVAYSETNYSIGTDKLTVGKPSAADRKIIFNKGGNNPAIKWNNSSGKLEYSNDGSTFKAIGSGGGGSGVNLLENFDLESGIDVNFTALSLTSTLRTGANALFGTRSVRLNSSAASQTYTSDQYTVPLGLKGRPCIAGIHYTTSESTNKYKLEVIDGSSNILASVELDASSTVKPDYVGFTCPDSGTIAWRINSTGDAADLDLDNVHLGSEMRDASLSQATVVGTAIWEPTTNCTWGTSSVIPTFGNFGVDSDCPTPTVTGELTAPATKIPAVTLPVLKPGKYVVLVNGLMVLNSGNTGRLRVSDGTNALNGQGYLWNATEQNTVNEFTAIREYTTPQSNVTFQLQGAIGGGGSISIPNDGNHSRLTITVFRYPTSSETGLRVDQLGWRVDATIAPTTGEITLSSTVASDYSSISNANLELTNRSGYGRIAAKIPCSSTNPPTGTTCSAGSEEVGVVYNQPTAGEVKACFTFAHYSDNGSSSSVMEMRFMLAETPLNAQTILQSTPAEVSRQWVGDGGVTKNITLCGNFNFASSGEKAIRLFYRTIANTSTSTNHLRTNTGEAPIKVEIYPINYLSGAMPIYKGMVTSNSAGRERIERAVFSGTTIGTACSSGSSCTINSQSGSWLSSVSRNSSGNYTLNIASGIFSDTPSCAISCGSTSTGNVFTTLYNMSTHSATSISFGTVDSTLNNVNSACSVVCQGPN